MDTTLVNTQRVVAAKARILVVDGDVDTRNILVGFLGDAGYLVEAVGNEKEAMETVWRLSAGLVLTDLRLPGSGGLELLRQLQCVDSCLLGIALTGYGTVSHAVRAMKSGVVFDFITKPFDSDVVEASVKRAFEFRQLKEENHHLQLAIREKYRFENFVVNGAAMQHAPLHATSHTGAGQSWECDSPLDLSKSIDEFETRLIMEALRRANGVKSRAAKLLRMNRTTLVEKLKKKGVSNPRAGFPSADG